MTCFNTKKDMNTDTSFISDLIAKSIESSDQYFVSYEFFPPKTKVGVEILMEKMKSLASPCDEHLKIPQPLFMDITWGAGGSTSDLTLQLVTDAMASLSGNDIPINMHLTCTNTSRLDIIKTIEYCRNSGIKNILALRGDPPPRTTTTTTSTTNDDSWVPSDASLKCALDLINLIQKDFKQSFGISVAGYPEGHPSSLTKVSDLFTLSASEAARVVELEEDNENASSYYVCLDADYEAELQYLKSKSQAAGKSSVIITQMFFDVNTFLTFVTNCRSIGITCPIIPGIMIISSYGGFIKMTRFCKTRVPLKLREQINYIMMMSKENGSKKIKEFGISYATTMCQALLDSKLVPGLHFYTLNQDSAVKSIISALNLNKKP